MKLKIKNTLKVLGNRLKQARINSGLTQADLADKIGMSVNAIKYAEKGKCKLETFVAILDALNLDSKIDLFLPEQLQSPLLAAKYVVKQRVRNRNSKVDNDIPRENLEW